MFVEPELGCSGIPAARSLLWQQGWRLLSRAGRQRCNQTSKVMGRKLSQGERYCVKFPAIRRPLKVSGLGARLKERTYPEEQGLRMWGGKDLFTRLFGLICFRCS